MLKWNKEIGQFFMQKLSKLYYYKIYFVSSVQFHFIYRALIERENYEAIRIDLRDNGAGSDLIANDGIYSRYFTR